MKMWILLLCAAVSSTDDYNPYDFTSTDVVEPDRSWKGVAKKCGKTLVVAGVLCCAGQVVYCSIYGQPDVYCSGSNQIQIGTSNVQLETFKQLSKLGFCAAAMPLCKMTTKVGEKCGDLKKWVYNSSALNRLTFAAELEERNWPKGSPSIDTCGHPLESFDKPIHVFISKDSEECKRKCDYLNLENIPHSEAMKKYYYENGKQKYKFPTYPFSAHKNQFVFDCNEVANNPICDWTLLKSDVLPSVCNLNSKNMICADEVPMHKSSITGRLYSPLCNLVHPTLNKLLDRADISNKGDLIVSSCKGWKNDYRSMWWGYFHIHSLEQDPQLYQEIADFMSPDPDKGCFGCPICKRHFSFELEHPFGEEAMKNMALVLWETHNRATWEIKSWKNAFNLFPGKSDCPNCRDENGWVMTNVQRALYSWFDQTVDLKYHSKCINYDEKSSCPGECYWNKFWNVCQKQPKVQQNTKLE